MLGKVGTAVDLAVTVGRQEEQSGEGPAGQQNVRLAVFRQCPLRAAAG